MQDGNHRHCILVVDDDVDLVEAARWMLEADGFEVEVALSAIEAFTRLDAGLRPCVMLLDIWMPDMDGWTASRNLQSRPEWRGIPVVMWSGSSEIVRAHAEGVAGMLAKPVEHDELIATILSHVRCVPLSEPCENPQDDPRNRPPVGLALLGAPTRTA